MLPATHASPSPSLPSAALPFTQMAAVAEWSQERTFHLIDDYRATPILWDMRIPNYNNTILKAEAVKELADKYGCDTTTIKKKLKNLRSAFMREHHHIYSNLGAGAKRVKWFAYDALTFLLDVITPKKRITSNGEHELEYENDEVPNDEESQNSDSNQADPTCIYIKQEPDIDIPIPQEVTSFSTTGNEPPPTKKPKIDQSISFEKEIVAMACRYLEKTTEAQENIPAIVKHWGERLEGLKHNQRLFAEKAINDILFEASLGNLRKDSVKINENS